MKEPPDALLHWLALVVFVVFIVTMFGFAWKVILQ